MKIVLTEPALADLESIWEYTSTHYPANLPKIERRFRIILERISELPAGFPRAAKFPAVRVALLRPFPFKVLYRLRRKDIIEILRVVHASMDI